MAFNLFLVLSLVFIVSTDERKLMNMDVNDGVPQVGMQCRSSYSVQDGDTCSDLVQRFQLTTSAFNVFNQNLDCDNLFIGQWICLNNVTIY
ncbi:hypothetical protein BT93_L2449 [Corymbia citriodora subsp. variegata]|uniref:LysM domain-containing protein n=1 Tax=Corymbia citriodora subsp. variegata TaxID=360336 RepID=A0A8T0CK08_CORYI|nr:hypothetical protein BT93_L2449 [Corymbia citriodora subsp. variegata]